MSESKRIDAVTIKSENFFSTEATEYQYFPYIKDGNNHLALTFYRQDVEVDISTADPKILAVRKALCTISLDVEVAKLLASQLSSMFETQEQISGNDSQSSNL